MNFVSTPKLTGTQLRAERSTPKTGGEKKGHGNSFVVEHGRRKEISEEYASRYRDIVNGNERIDRTFCETYKPLLASIKCNMVQCG